jgi:hypothetical protein
MYNVNYINESRYPQPSCKYEVLHKAIVRHNSQIYGFS